MYPLQGMRIVELSWWAAVPHGTQMLAELGAEVIKVETQGRPDDIRRLAPFADAITGVDRSGRYIIHNFSKKQVTLNLREPEARDLLRRLISMSDAFVENFSLGVVEKYGLDYDTLRKLRPDLVMYSGSALGKTGPKAHHVSWGPHIMAFAGVASLTGYAGGQPGVVEPFVSDYVAAVHCALAILMALYHRSQTGEGQYVDLSMAEAQIAQLPEAMVDYFMNGRVQQRVGNQHEAMAPHNAFPCQGDDKWVGIAVGTEDEWQALCRLMGNPVWTNDPRFADGPSRWAHQADLDRHIGTWTRQYTHVELMERLQAAQIAAGAALDPQELLSDPHLQARDVFISPAHPEAGERATQGLSWQYSRGPHKYDAGGLIDQHNWNVFHEILGLPDDDYRQLVDRGVIA